MTSDLVECRSDAEYIGRPVAFYWQEQRLEVAEVLSQSRSPVGYSFRVHSDSGDLFELVYDINSDQWSVQQL